MSSSIVFNEHYDKVMPRYPDKYFDLALCDVPYGLDVANMAFLKEVGTKVKQKNGSKINPNKGKKIYTAKDWDKSPPPQEYFDELVRVSKNQIIFGIEYVNWKGTGNGRIKWIKGIPEGVSFKKYELAYCSAIDNEVTLELLWAGMQQAKGLSEPMRQQGNKKLNEKRIHPCHKPILLYKKLILDYGFEGMRIIDTHLGGGSSRIAAHDFNCEFVGCEIDKEYFDLQENRFNHHINKLKLNLF